MAWTENDARRLLTNPTYCLGDKPIVSEEMWIKAATRMIQEEGAEVFLKELLENLRGNYR